LVDTPHVPNAEKYPGCSMSEMDAGAVLFNDLYTSMHILNSIRAATGSGLEVTQDHRIWYRWKA